MCRNIRTLFNFDPPATEEEVRAASLQFVRKLSGCQKPSKANEAAFAKAVTDVSRVAEQLLASLVTEGDDRLAQQTGASKVAVGTPVNPAPPEQIPASGTTALGSYLGC